MEHLRKDLILIADEIREERKIRARTKTRTLAERLRGELPLDPAAEVHEDQDSPQRATIFKPLDLSSSEEDIKDRIKKIKKTRELLDALDYRYAINDDGTIHL